MDHEVEDDVDVEGARAEDAEAVCLEEHGAVEVGLDGGNGGIEALEVSDLQDALFSAGQIDQGVGFLDGGGDGFFDEQVDARMEEFCGNLGVRRRGHADGGGVDVEAAAMERVEACLDGRKDGSVPLLAQAGGEGGVALDDGCEFDGNGGGGGELAIDAQVIESEGAGSDDRDVQCVVQGDVARTAAAIWSPGAAVCGASDQARPVPPGRTAACDSYGNLPVP